MKWRPHTEKPTEIPVVAIIAVEDEESERYLLWGLYTFTRAERRWWNEETGEGIKDRTYWWMPEDELVAELPK